jgi:hypothetical protein
VDAEARILVTVGSALQLLGICMTAIYLRRSRQRFSHRAASLRRSRMDAAQQGAVASLMAALIALFISARTDARKTWQWIGGYALACAWWLLRRAEKLRRRLGAEPEAPEAAIAVSPPSPLVSSRAPRIGEVGDLDRYLDAVASFADELASRLDEERRDREELIGAERSARSLALEALNRDLDELAAGGIRLGAWGVVFLVAGTALSLAAAWT